MCKNLYENIWWLATSFVSSEGIILLLRIVERALPSVIPSLSQKRSSLKVAPWSAILQRPFSRIGMKCVRSELVH